MKIVHIYEVDQKVVSSNEKIKLKCCVCKNTYLFYHNTSEKTISTYACKNCIEKEDSIENRIKQNSKRTRKCVYIIVNPIYKNWIKIGVTNVPIIRLNTYQLYTPFRDFSLYYKSSFVNDAYGFEQFFKFNLPSNGTEWYNINPESALKIIKQLEEIDAKHKAIINSTWKGVVID